MIRRNRSNHCETAREYYFDYLDSASRMTIPSSILTHMATCDHCQAHVQRLSEGARVGPSEAVDMQDSRDAAIVDLLSQHFVYADVAVTCAVVKPFLPSLADPELAIRIPTPITVHVERCEECRRDIAALQSWHLSGGQLLRMSRFLAIGEGPSGPDCDSIAPWIPSAAALDFEECDPRIWTHLAACPACRQRVYDLRAKSLEDLKAERPRGLHAVACPGDAAADLFDCVLPAGTESQADSNGGFRRPLCEHVRQCPMCLSTIQSLHEQLFRMADRPDSGVTTYTSVQEAATEEEGAAALQGSTAEAAAAEDASPSPTAERTGGSAAGGRRRSWMGWAVRVAAAAVLLLGIGVVTLMPSAKAVSVAGIFHVVGRAHNLHIVTFSGAQTQLLQEVWVSKDLQQYVLKQGAAIAWWDLVGRTRSAVDPVSGSVFKIPLSQDDRVLARRQMEMAAGFLPFDRPSSVPAEAQWIEVAPSPDEGQAVEVRELRWTEPRDASQQIWRVHVDRATGLPRRCEYCRKQGAQSDEEVLTTIAVTALSRAEMQAALDTLRPR